MRGPSRGEESVSSIVEVRRHIGTDECLVTFEKLGYTRCIPYNPLYRDRSILQILCGKAQQFFRMRSVNLIWCFRAWGWRLSVSLGRTDSSLSYELISKIISLSSNHTNKPRKSNIFLSETPIKMPYLQVSCPRGNYWRRLIP